MSESCFERREIWEIGCPFPGCARLKEKAGPFPCVYQASSNQQPDQILPPKWIDQEPVVFKPGHQPQAPKPKRPPPKRIKNR